MKKRNLEFNSGSVSLDLVDTLGNRRAETIEHLVAPSDLDQWLTMAELASPFGDRSTQKYLNDARILRDAIYRLALNAVENTLSNSADFVIVNRWSQKMPLRPVVENNVIKLVARNPIEAAFSSIAADAIELIFGARRSRIRVCEECKMVFVDNSRPGIRRWCSSASGCGNRAKVRNHRSKIKEK